MDIVVKIKPLKATHESFTFVYKTLIGLLMLSLMTLIIPHEAVAAGPNDNLVGPMVFEVGDHSEYVSDYISNIQERAALKFSHETAVAKLRKQMKLVDAVKSYLIQQRSPLAEYTGTLLQQNNWKKIIALSNAESTMCRKYIEATANCWGVGGTDLWDMGNNLGEGVAAMNSFLNNAPSKSPVKYSQMNFNQMNGLYKQPAREHWVLNNLAVYNDLTAIEKAIK